MNFSPLKVVFGIFFVITFVFSGYLGYLSALVDLDEERFFREVMESSDKVRLEKQLARAKSILDARSRAYLRRSQEFVRLQQGAPELSAADRAFQASLEEEKNDLVFFEDEVAVIEQTLAREDADRELARFMASDRQRRRVSSSLEQLLQLLDKRKELSVKRKAALTGYQYWEKNEKQAPSSIAITVSNKDQIQRKLNPLHTTQITTALSIMPSGFDKRMRNMYIVYGDPKMRRGMTGVGVVFMKGEELDFFRVMIHEFGHLWDLHREVNDGEKSQFYDGEYRLFQTDPSVTYYSYGWSSNTQRTSGADGYASTYGMSDPFEDFAEAFALYIMQNNTFVSWKNSNDVMARKYQFFNELYGGRVFNSSDPYSTRPYDVTMMVVDYESLLKTGG
jgi:hypothetical protein